jgi:uncharacterized protein with NRDE domain
MCIGLVATSHPKYALIVINSREEYILRPTSRPHFWEHKPSGSIILSSRDLLRRERGTWIGISKKGRLALLTNYREPIDQSESAWHGVKSRGEIVSSWLGAPEDENLDQFVDKTLKGRLLKGIGGFSLICGDIKGTKDQNIEPLIVISNRSDETSVIPKFGDERGKVWGLSNTVFEEPPTWPKIILGKQLVAEAVDKAVARGASEDELADLLFSVLDTNKMPPRARIGHEEYVDLLKNSIFCPPVTDEERERDMAAAIERGKRKPPFDEIEEETHGTVEHSPPKGSAIFDKGAYGTQRQTIILIGWDGVVTYKERALWDAHGNQIERGKGDVTIKFGIEEWRS